MHDDFLQHRWPQFEAVRRCWADGDLDRSAELIDAALAHDPDDPGVLLVSAFQLLEEAWVHGWARADEIRAMVARATALAADDAHAHVGAALALVQLGDVEGAGKHAAAAETHGDELSEGSVRAALAYVHGRVLVARGHPGLAEPHLRAAAEHCAEEDEFAASWIEALRVLGRREEADGALRAALRRHPRSARLLALERDGTQVTFTTRRRRA
jgi:tetratricopeptide (TPR) repeat protein